MGFEPGQWYSGLEVVGGAEQVGKAKYSLCDSIGHWPLPIRKEARTIHFKYSIPYQYFDSGDYNMARGQAAKGPQPKLKGKTITGERLVVPDEPTGDSHPSPELIPQRKVSISQVRRQVYPVFDMSYDLVPTLALPKSLSCN